MKFSEILKELREDRQLKQKELAQKTGLSPQCISALENGSRTPTSQTLAALTRYFQVPSDYLLGLIDEFGNPIVTQEEKSAGATATRRVSLTPIEDQMLYYFREIGKNNGEQGQHAALAVLETLANSKKKKKM